MSQASCPVRRQVLLYKLDRFNYTVMQPKDAEEMANSVDPDEKWSSVILVFTVCSDLSASILGTLL